jgi:hypothetical protein
MSDAPPPVTPEQLAIANTHKEDLAAFHGLVDGRLVVIHDMMNTIAMANNKPPLPPPAIAYLCEVTEEQTKGCGPEGPTVTVDQLVNAFAKMIPPGDPPAMFEEKVIQHVRDASKRRMHANKVMPSLKPNLLALHGKVGGSSDKLYAWFLDLLPVEAQDSFPKEAFMGMIMRTPPDQGVISPEAFLSGVHNNMDENDTVEKIMSVIDKHMAL